jgi:hypothetical protein
MPLTGQYHGAERAGDIRVLQWDDREFTPRHYPY